MNKGTTTLKATKREVLGRKTKRLRENGVIPANVYGKHVDSQSIEVSREDFLEVFKKVHETGLVELLIGDEKRPVLITNTQIDPVYGEVIHVDFLQVNLKEKVKSSIPVEISGESPAQKSGIGTVVIQLSEVEIEALPGDLPDKFEVSLDELVEVDQAIFVKDLKFDKEKIELHTDLEQIIVKVEPPQKEEVVEVAPTEEVVEGAAPEGTSEEGNENASEEQAS